jgi:hypothetical protein
MIGSLVYKYALTRDQICGKKFWSEMVPGHFVDSSGECFFQSYLALGIQTSVIGKQLVYLVLPPIMQF